MTHTRFMSGDSNDIENSFRGWSVFILELIFLFVIGSIIFGILESEWLNSIVDPLVTDELTGGWEEWVSLIVNFFVICCPILIFGFCASFTSLGREMMGLVLVDDDDEP